MASKQEKPSVVVESLASFLAEVEDVVQFWTPDREFDPWFRGQGNESWPLVPSLYRPENHKFLDEDDFRDDFKRRAWPYLVDTAREPADEWEWYFLMQHYGLPTRLLDWTESSLVALYFALQAAKDRANPVVWVLDPWALNKKVAKKGDVVLSPGETRIKRYILEPFSGETLPRYPIAIQPPLKSKRIAVQRGEFTLHGQSPKALNAYALLKDYLKPIVIKAHRVPDMKEQLRVAGMTETTVFPELTGLCRELVEFWREKPDSEKIVGEKHTRAQKSERARRLTKRRQSAMSRGRARAAR